MTEFLLTHGSYLAIMIVLILTGAGLPVPEEVPIVAAGVLSAHGQLDPWLAMGACLFGALAGDCVMYWIGRHFGRAFLREHPWWARIVKPEREEKMERMLHDHGLKVFFLARFLVGVRSPVYLSAGILRVPFRRFFLIDCFCATSVISVFFGLSYYFGQTIAKWIREAQYGLTGVAVVTVAIVALLLWRRHRAKELQEHLVENPLLDTAVDQPTDKAPAESPGETSAEPSSSEPLLRSTNRFASTSSRDEDR